MAIQPLTTQGLIVSCQAAPEDPLYGPEFMVRMALAAEQGGAIGIRCNGRDDIEAIKRAVSLPVIGLIKREIAGSDIYITPELEDVRAILEAGADIVALDLTNREDRYTKGKALIDYVHKAGSRVMADISTAEEALQAERMGVDYVSTTLSGYTPYSPQQEGPDLELIASLRGKLSVPLVAEGRIWSAEEAVAALAGGADYVVVGTAITRPQLVTQRFVNKIADFLSQTQTQARLIENKGG
ncbi:putative N-acetylmannosamine-6-phosphate 2-epimerase [Cohnella xylanilytica]|uniref:Putative N-acetylmannosamine-6-phosphate 2-epimerase n=1 Tax=Cohnella xylanilytica TaxID=557555 RepID=A0A841U532_9BACL|nr:N-acetylmannosamine-6-phosphate 2-epimerase [Cohnella xylanilytica]MBB6695726.1 N-acetylmannosamine-6-phosphate 2-epimerase [Cohnella xylanilytica]GIO16779.1 putative N-acetylmannosamine-6-phosphate 2-epimerase [Cohnella xylanilytica]